MATAAAGVPCPGSTACGVEANLQQNKASVWPTRRLRRREAHAHDMNKMHGWLLQLEKQMADLKCCMLCYPPGLPSPDVLDLSSRLDRVEAALVPTSVARDKTGDSQITLQSSDGAEAQPEPEALPMKADCNTLFHPCVNVSCDDEYYRISCLEASTQTDHLDNGVLVIPDTNSLREVVILGAIGSLQYKLYMRCQVVEECLGHIETPRVFGCTHQDVMEAAFPDFDLDGALRDCSSLQKSASGALGKLMSALSVVEGNFGMEWFCHSFSDQEAAQLADDIERADFQEKEGDDEHEPDEEGEDANTMQTDNGSDDNDNDGIEELCNDSSGCASGEDANAREDDKDNEGDADSSKAGESNAELQEKAEAGGKAKKWRCYHCWTHLEDERATCRYCKDKTVAKQFLPAKGG